MKTKSAPIDALSAAELAAFPVWEFAPESASHDETWVRPIADLPVKSLDGRLAVTHLNLADGTTRLGILGNVSLDDPSANEHFLTLSLFATSGERFHLARYHDADFAKRSPAALAKFLELPVDAVFPISYDISNIASGASACLRGQLSAVPRTRLSHAEIISLAVSPHAP